MAADAAALIASLIGRRRRKMKAILLAALRATSTCCARCWASNCRFAPSCSEYASEAIAKARRGERRVARAASRPALSPVSSGRLRPGSLKPHPLSQPSPFRRSQPTLGDHGYATPDSVRHLLVLRGLPVGGLAEGAASAAARCDGAETGRGADRRLPTCRRFAAAPPAATPGAAAPAAAPGGIGGARSAPGSWSRSRPTSTARRSTRPAA